MLRVPFSGVRNQQMIMMMPVLVPSLGDFRRYDFDGYVGFGSDYRKETKNRAGNATAKKAGLCISPMASSALAESRSSSRADLYKQVLEAANDKFTREISFQSKDNDISLAKALLYVAAEDEAFLSFNREINVCSLHNERRDTSSFLDALCDGVEAMPMAGKDINEWLVELDTIAKEVEAELVSRDIGCHLAEVLDAVNKVLFQLRGFKRSPVIVDSKCSYLHNVLSSGCSSAILLSVIYIEVCRRLNLTIVGSRVGEEFLIWPQTGMLRAPFFGVRNQQMIMMMTCGLGASSMAMPMVVSFLGDCRRITRYDFDGLVGFGSDYGKGKKNCGMAPTTGNDSAKKLLCTSLMASSALAESCNSSGAALYKQVLETARDKFTREISFQLKDKDISLAKALLYVAAEDEAFLAFNREVDICSLLKERRDTSLLSDALGWDSVEAMPMAGKNVNEWLVELDTIAKEVECELVSRDIGCHLAEVLDAVNKVLFELRGFKRSPAIVDTKCTYLHSVLRSGNSSAILFSVIYIEVCRRLNLTIVGSRDGEEFLIWPSMGNPEELFKVTCGRSLFGVVNGKCVDGPQSKASEINSHSLLGLDIAMNRDIIGIALANLIRLYWKCASRPNRGLMLTSPLRPVHKSEEKLKNDCDPEMRLLRPQELRLAIMASERLLILQPHNWSLRRDYGMMLYYKKEYGIAVQELSICMAFAPEEETQVLESFIKRLHLMRLETKCKPLGQQGKLKFP